MNDNMTRWTSFVTYAVTGEIDKTKIFHYNEHSELDEKMEAAQIGWASLRTISTKYNGGFGIVVPQAQLFFEGDIEPMSSAYH